MDLPLARAAATVLEVLESVGSTNAELAARERRGAQQHGTVIVTLDQTAGRGRLGREWVAPSGSAIAVSVLLSSALPTSAISWLPLIGGLAAVEAVAAELANSAVEVKWPNDVLVTGRDGRQRKIAGVLAELVGETGAVVLGIGVNTAMAERDLPVPTATATSIAIERPAVVDDSIALADRVVAAIISGVLQRVAALDAASGDARAAGLIAELQQRCGTIGRRVSVQLPGGAVSVGTATGIDQAGALIVATDDGVVTAVHAGDVTHLRYEWADTESVSTEAKGDG